MLKDNINNKSETVHDILTFGKSYLKSANIDSYSIDSEVLLMKALNFSKIQLFTKDNYVLSPKEKKLYFDLLEKRNQLMPVQYIVGTCEFMGLDFDVNSSTLIPRGDTEILVEYAIDMINQNNYKAILDIGTGSGAIAISIAKYCKNTKITAVDISTGALEMAKSNAEKNAVLDRIQFTESNLFENINSKFDVIVSNPPYIRTDVIPTLMPQVKDYEPVTALDGGIDGLDFYKDIISNAKNYLNKKGMLIFEIGYNQSNDVSELLKQQNFSNIKTLKDLAGLDRVVTAIYNEKLID